MNNKLLLLITLLVTTSRPHPGEWHNIGGQWCKIGDPISLSPNCYHQSLPQIEISKPHYISDTLLGVSIAATFFAIGCILHSDPNYIEQHARTLHGEIENKLSFFQRHNPFIHYGRYIHVDALYVAIASWLIFFAYESIQTN